MSITYLPVDPLPTLYIEDSIIDYTSFFIVPSGANTLPNTCILVLSSDGTTVYAFNSFTFLGSTFQFSSYENYWKTHMNDLVKL